MNFFRSMEIDPTCKFSPPQSRSGGISFYGFSAPRRFHATKTHSAHQPLLEFASDEMILACPWLMLLSMSGSQAYR